MTNININSGLIFRVLLMVIVLLTITGAFAHYLKLNYNYNDSLISKQFVRLFILDEMSIPTWYSAALLTVCSFLLGFIAYLKYSVKAPHVLHWAALSLIFILLSIDDTTELHERLSVVDVQIGGSDFKYSWLFFGIAFVAAMFVIFYRFIFSLPTNIRNLFILSGILFVTGAIGFEIIGWSHKEFFFQGNNFSILFSTVEETLEMLGTAVFIYALLNYIKFHSNNFIIQVEN